MKWTLIIALTLVTGFATSAMAQSSALIAPAVGTEETQRAANSGEVGDLPPLSESTISSHPEIYLYLQAMKRYDDPSHAIRRKAEYKASQRIGRIESSKWFGISNARPQANPVPMMGTYSPVWTGNTGNPYEWSAITATPYTNVWVNRNRW